MTIIIINNNHHHYNYDIIFIVVMITIIFIEISTVPACHPCTTLSNHNHGLKFWYLKLRLLKQQSRHRKLCIYTKLIKFPQLQSTSRFTRHALFLKQIEMKMVIHDDVNKWKHFPRYWPFVRGIHRSPVNSPHKGQWRRALMFSFICARINGWANNRKAGDLRRHRGHYDVTVMSCKTTTTRNWIDTIIVHIAEYSQTAWFLTVLFE